MWRYRKPGFALLLLGELQRQQQSSHFCDTLLQTEGVSVPAHSCVLAALSPIFSQALSSYPSLPVGQSRLLKLQAVGAHALLKLVGFLYSGEMGGEGLKEQEEVISAANQLGFSCLVEAEGMMESRRADGWKKWRDVCVQTERTEGDEEEEEVEEKGKKKGVMRDASVQVLSDAQMRTDRWTQTANPEVCLLSVQTQCSSSAVLSNGQLSPLTETATVNAHNQSLVTTYPTARHQIACMPLTRPPHDPNSGPAGSDSEGAFCGESEYNGGGGAFWRQVGKGHTEERGALQPESSLGGNRPTVRAMPGRQRKPKKLSARRKGMRRRRERWGLMNGETFPFTESEGDDGGGRERARGRAGHGQRGTRLLTQSETNISLKIRLKREKKGALWEIMSLQEQGRDVSEMKNVSSRPERSHWYHEKPANDTVNVEFPKDDAPLLNRCSPRPVSCPALHQQSFGTLTLTPPSDLPTSPGQSGHHTQNLVPASSLRNKLSTSPDLALTEESDEQIEKLLEDIMIDLNILPPVTTESQPSSSQDLTEEHCLRGRDFAVVKAGGHASRRPETAFPLNTIQSSNDSFLDAQYGTSLAYVPHHCLHCPVTFPPHLRNHCPSHTHWSQTEGGGSNTVHDHNSCSTGLQCLGPHRQAECKTGGGSSVETSAVMPTTCSYPLHGKEHGLPCPNLGELNNVLCHLCGPVENYAQSAGLAQRQITKTNRTVPRTGEEGDFADVSAERHLCNCSPRSFRDMSLPKCLSPLEQEESKVSTLTSETLKTVPRPDLESPLRPPAAQDCSHQPKLSIPPWLSSFPSKLEFPLSCMVSSSNPSATIHEVSPSPLCFKCSLSDVTLNKESYPSIVRPNKGVAKNVNKQARKTVTETMKQGNEGQEANETEVEGCGSLCSRKNGNVVILEDQQSKNNTGPNWEKACKAQPQRVTKKSSKRNEVVTVPSSDRQGMAAGVQTRQQVGCLHAERGTQQFANKQKKGYKFEEQGSQKQSINVKKSAVKNTNKKHWRSKPRCCENGGKPRGKVHASAHDVKRGPGRPRKIQRDVRVLVQKLNNVKELNVQTPGQLASGGFGGHDVETTKGKRKMDILEEEMQTAKRRKVVAVEPREVQAGADRGRAEPKQSVPLSGSTSLSRKARQPSVIDQIFHQTPMSVGGTASGVILPIGQQSGGCPQDAKKRQSTGVKTKSVGAAPFTFSKFKEIVEHRKRKLEMGGSREGKKLIEQTNSQIETKTNTFQSIESNRKNSADEEKAQLDKTDSLIDGDSTLVALNVSLNADLSDLADKCVDDCVILPLDREVNKTKLLEMDAQGKSEERCFQTLRSEDITGDTTELIHFGSNMTRLTEKVSGMVGVVNAGQQDGTEHGQNNQENTEFVEADARRRNQAKTVSEVMAVGKMLLSNEHKTKKLNKMAELQPEQNGGAHEVDVSRCPAEMEAEEDLERHSLVDVGENREEEKLGGAVMDEEVEIEFEESDTVVIGKGDRMTTNEWETTEVDVEETEIMLEVEDEGEDLKRHKTDRMIHCSSPDAVDTEKVASKGHSHIQQANRASPVLVSSEVTPRSTGSWEEEEVEVDVLTGSPDVLPQTWAEGPSIMLQAEEEEEEEEGGEEEEINVTGDETD